ncbi:MAG: hypothetical protein AAF558_13735 [Verrucomicrobiota bacterium]
MKCVAGSVSWLAFAFFIFVSPIETYAQKGQAKATYQTFVATAKSARSMKTLMRFLSAEEISRYNQSMSWHTTSSAKTKASKKKLARWKSIANQYVSISKVAKNKKGYLLTLKTRSDAKFKTGGQQKKILHGVATVQMVNEKGAWKVGAYNDRGFVYQM